MEFDNLTYLEEDPEGLNVQNLVAPWDTNPVLGHSALIEQMMFLQKINYDFSPNLRFNVSYWEVHAHRKGFNSRYLYWDEGQNELFRDTKRFTAELNHTLEGGKTFHCKAIKFCSRSIPRS